MAAFSVQECEKSAIDVYVCWLLHWGCLSHKLKGARARWQLVYDWGLIGLCPPPGWAETNFPRVSNLPSLHWYYSNWNNSSDWNGLLVLDVIEREGGGGNFANDCHVSRHKTNKKRKTLKVCYWSWAEVLWVREVEGQNEILIWARDKKYPLLEGAMAKTYE